jgi:hypothetical protein
MHTRSTILTLILPLLVSHAIAAPRLKLEEAGEFCIREQLQDRIKYWEHQMSVQPAEPAQLAALELAGGHGIHIKLLGN